MGCCWSQHSLDMPVDYKPLTYNSRGLSTVSEVSVETDVGAEISTVHV